MLKYLYRRGVSHMKFGFFAKKETIKQAMIIIESILFEHSQAKISMLIPKDDFSLFEQYSIFERIKIILIDIPYQLIKYPFADKIYAASIYEQNNQNFYFLDVDSFLMRPIKDELFNQDIMINPVDIKNVGILKDEKVNDFWSYLLDKVKISINDYTSSTFKTIITDETIYPYYNAGFIFIGQNKHLFSQTVELMHKLSSDQSFLPILQTSYLNSLFLHQVLLTIMMIKIYGYDQIYSLPENYNFPLHLYQRKENKPDFYDLKTIRYDDYFNHPSPEISKYLPLHLLKYFS